ncbi:precorrin-3B synthase [Herbidospora galbida]|uniref:Precorrin-3B synthase n=1 Tax=Herbidospora galbida TaxID=2575442 RepID=A0A4U3LS44_9ACTN|nr:precorrin-3B synthase [Herbidospora galbida]
MTGHSSRDACPGALQVHPAADGPLARVRLPGGDLTGAQLGVLAASGGGVLELTSRANVQVRGVKDPAGFAEAVAAAGLLPSPSHERVRNIVASPLNGSAAFRGVVRDLDAAICAVPELADLSGRFLFAVDDGSGDVAGLGADVVLMSRGEHFAVIAGTTDLRLRLPPAQAVHEAVHVAQNFLRVSDGAWRIPEGAFPGVPADLPAPRTGGYVGDFGDTTGVLAPLGRLTATQATVLAEAEWLRITPWRTVLVPKGTRLPDGLITDPESPWLHVTACTGSPGCAKSLSDVQKDAEPIGVPVHWSGCGRKCGRPRGEVVDLIATTSGYQRSAS